MTAAQEYAARAVKCPTCRRMPGRRCTTPSGRTVRAHAARIRLAVARTADAPTCPRLSPESRTPCTLPDRREWHAAGHEAPLPGNPCGSVSWGTDAADVARWEGAA